MNSKIIDIFFQNMQTFKIKSINYFKKINTFLLNDKVLNIYFYVTLNST